MIINAMDLQLNLWAALLNLSAAWRDVKILSVVVDMRWLRAWRHLLGREPTIDFQTGMQQVGIAILHEE